MHLPDLLSTIIYTISVGTATSVLTWLIIKRWFATRMKHERKIMFMDIKIDCIVEGLCNVNHNYGIEFKAGYDKALKSAMNEQNFIDK